MPYQSVPFKQMYGDTDPEELLNPIGNITLTAYSGGRIKFFGNITLMCKYGQSEWMRATFYVVDVPRPVVLGLPLCEALKLVTINCHVETFLTSVPKKPLNTVQDVMVIYVPRPVPHHGEVQGASQNSPKTGRRTSTQRLSVQNFSAS